MAASLIDALPDVPSDAIHSCSGSTQRDGARELDTCRGRGPTLPSLLDKDYNSLGPRNSPVRNCCVLTLPAAIPRNPCSFMLTMCGQAAAETGRPFASFRPWAQIEERLQKTTTGRQNGGFARSVRSSETSGNLQFADIVGKVAGAIRRWLVVFRSLEASAYPWLLLGWSNSLETLATEIVDL